MADQAPRRTNRSRRLLLCAVLGLSSPALLGAQDNVVDARVAELNDRGKLTYQNFIYARTLSSQRFIVQALYLRIPVEGAATYNEVAGGAGVRLFSASGFSVFAMASIAHATDANYVEPALFAQGSAGRFSASAYVQRYAPLGDGGIDQWLVDPVEAQVTVAGKLALGASAYMYRASGNGSQWLTKFGPKIGLGDDWGATELRVGAVRNSSAKTEFQLRRLVVF
jgi:hypothetical protein